VALSRCKSFEGIVLRSKIAFSSVKTDVVVKNYTEEADKNTPDETHLLRSKTEFQQSLLLELFDFSRLRRHFSQATRVFLEHENSLHKDGWDQLQTLESQTTETVFSIAERFKPQIQQYFQTAIIPEENQELQDRLQKAGQYFTQKIGSELLPAARNIPVLTDNKSVQKAALTALEALQKEFFIKNACFSKVQSGFSASLYMRSKADAELDFRTTNPAAMATKTADAPKNTPHPELFMRLKKWRDDVAEDNNMILFEVLPTRSLIELVHLLPLNLNALKKIKGIGAAKSQRFGAELIGIIQRYCSERKIDAGQLAGIGAAALTENYAKTDTKTLSLNLFKSGKTVSEIAAERTLTQGTIEGHLAHFVGLGELDIFSLMSQEQVSEITTYLKVNNSATSTEVKAYFEDKYTYHQIKLVMQYLSSEAASD
jgi:hypothetical protein